MYLQIPAIYLINFLTIFAYITVSAQSISMLCLVMFRHSQFNSALKQNAMCLPYQYFTETTIFPRP